MKRLFTSPDLIQASQLRDVLEREGIPCLIRNDILAGLAPEVPFTEAFPEVWVQNDSDWGRAETIKNDWRKVGQPLGSSWTCPDCGELLEAQFSSCWKCGAGRPV
jgi:hypothetical protein